MAISTEQFDALANVNTASWALWSPGFNKAGCVEANPQAVEGYLRKRISELRANVVLLGLSRGKLIHGAGGDSPRSWPHYANFHTLNHAGDGLVCEAVSKLENLRGAFMTDLSSIFEANSQDVLVGSQDYDELRKQLRILGAKEFHVVCFGLQVFDGLKKVRSSGVAIDQGDEVSSFTLKDGELTLHCYRVVHYSYVVRRERKGEKTKKDRFLREMGAAALHCSL